MKLVELELENALGIPDGSYDLARPGASAEDRVTLVMGPRGAGKTALLEAIVFARESIGGLGPPRRPESLLRAGATSGRVHAVFRLDAEEQQSAELESAGLVVTIDLRPDAPPLDVPRGARELFGRFSADGTESKLEYFPDNRCLDAPGAATTIDQEKRLRPTRLPLKYAGLIPSLAALSSLDGARALADAGRRGMIFSGDAPDSLGPYRHALARLVPEVDLRGVLPGDGGPELMVALRSGAVVAARALSGAQKQGLLLAGTIVRLGLDRSLVLVDTPELYIHPADHEAFFRGLLALLPHAQLIVATASDAIARCVGPHRILVLGAPR